VAETAYASDAVPFRDCDACRAVSGARQGREMDPHRLNIDLHHIT